MKPGKKSSAIIPIKLFRKSKDWIAWLERNYGKSQGVWLRIAKKAAATRTVTYDEALEAALCYGWIDAQKKGYDDDAWLQKFTPRGKRSIWSKINRQKARMLIEEGRMKPAGVQAVERAKENGQWEAAYDAQGHIEMPEDFKKELERRPAARNFFTQLNSSNRYAILHRLQTAKKPETRAKRLRKFLEMLEKREKLHP